MAGKKPLSPDEWSFWGDWMRAHRLLVRELDRSLQNEFGISKAEFSILVTVHDAGDNSVRVVDLADALDWDKGRVAHQLTRMERRGLLRRSEAGAAGRRTGVALTGTGRDVVTRAIRSHGVSIRRVVLDRLSPEQAEVIGGWSREFIDRVDSGR